jgi:hypothetical protein
MFKQEKNKQNLHDDKAIEETRISLQGSESNTLNWIYQEVKVLKVLFKILDFMFYILVPAIFFTAEFLVAWQQSKSILIAALSGFVFFSILKLLTIVIKTIVKRILENNFSS